MRPSDYVERGWCQNGYAKDDLGAAAYAAGPGATHWCPLGALSRSFTRKEITRQQSIDLENTMRYLVPTMTLWDSGREEKSVAAWNDLPSRTKEEVLDMMRHAERLVLGEA